MLAKKFFFGVVLIALVLSTMALSPGTAAAQVDLKARARDLLASQLQVSPESLTQVGRGVTVKYPLQGIKVHEFKFINQAGRVFVISVNENGERANVNGLDAKEQKIYQTRNGKIEKQLAKLLSTANPEDVIEVDIWLKMPEGSAESVLEKPQVNGGPEIQPYANREEGKLAAKQNQEAAIEFDAEAWDAIEVNHTEQVITGVEAVTQPFAEQLRAEGYDATAGSLAPIVNVKLPVSLIREYAKQAGVEQIYLGAELGQEINIARQVIGSSNVNSLGITGTGSKIAVVEYGGMIPTTNPYLSGTTRDNLYGCAIDGHVTGIAGEIRSTHRTYKGVAPGTSLWVGCGKTDAQIQTMASRANTWGADTYSLSWYSGITRTPTAMDKFFDGYMFNYFDLVVKSAGNRGTSDGWVTPPGLGYNTLTVGSFDDRNTITTTDDVMASYSSYVDPLSSHNDREKPEVAAPGSNIMSTTTASPWTGNIGSGTSFAAPIVAGITSLMYQRNATLKSWPESTKAIIMATAIRNKEGATRLSEKDGAGGVWALSADYVARNNTIYGRWGGRSYPCTTATNLNVASMYLYAGRKARIVLVWDQNPNYAYYTSKPSADLELQIWRGTTLIGGSYSWDNTYEIVEFTPTVSGTYTIQVDKSRCDLTPNYLGWAWSQP